MALLSWLYPCDVTACINIISLVHVFSFPFLSQLFYLMRLPTVMTTDHGKEFHNRVNDELMKVFGIKHRLTTAYHPQANGLDERLNQTLINSLTKFAQEDHIMWNKNLLEVVYAYNTAVQDSSKFTPFEAMFGRVARLPVYFIATTNYDADAKVKVFVDAADEKEQELASKCQKTEDAIKQNIEVAQRKQEMYYDQKHSAASCFSVGSLVLNRDFTRKKRRGGKLDYRWEGPYVISSSLGNGLFSLKELKESKVQSYVPYYYYDYVPDWHLSVHFLLFIF